MTEKERTHFFFFFARLRACISDDALFEAKRAIFEGKKEQSFGRRFQRKIERKCTRLLYRER
jgi:hypothetical protein